MTSQLMLPTTATAISGLLGGGEAFGHAPEEEVLIKPDDEAMRPVLARDPQGAALGRARRGHDAKRAALEAKEFGPEEEADGAGIVNRRGVAVDARLGHEGCDELGGLSATCGKRRGEA